MVVVEALMMIVDESASGSDDEGVESDGDNASQ